jgi:hypothetical protein
MRNLSRALSGTINGASKVPDPGVTLTRGLRPARGDGKRKGRARGLGIGTAIRKPVRITAG